MLTPRFRLLSGMIILAALSRLVPHPWNFSPLTAMALFSGAYFSNRKAAFAVPMFALFLSDVMLGFYPTMLFSYVSFALIVWMGFRMQGNVNLSNVCGRSLLGSCLFFFITNTAHWVFTNQYDKSVIGLMHCYTMALPFFQNAVMGDIFYSALLFGSFSLAERRLPQLRTISQ